MGSLYKYDSLSIYHWLIKKWDNLFKITDIWIIDVKSKKKFKFKVSLINLIKTKTRYFFKLFLFIHLSAPVKKIILSEIFIIRKIDFSWFQNTNSAVPCDEKEIYLKINKL